MGVAGPRAAWRQRRGRHVQTVEITGGAGRFAGASGSAVVEGVINLSTFEYDGQVNGAIQLAGSP